VSAWPRDRLALVEASTKAPSTESSPVSDLTQLCVGTGYFVSTDLVLTARHVVLGADSIQVRVEAAAVEEHKRWVTGEVVWTGLGDLDAALVRVASTISDWEVPPMLPDYRGPWESEGYAQAVASTTSGRRKTLPLAGTLGQSRGQGAAELLLTTDATVLPDRLDGWQGMSGAPVFKADSDELVGIITDANAALGNGLIAAPIERLLAHPAFRIAISTTRFVKIPAGSWCLVLACESGRSDLRDKVSDVIAGYGNEDPVLAEMDRDPVLMNAHEAVANVENWCTAVQALAAADYVVADVSGFQPAVMALLGVRSAMRRGVTISVSAREEGHPIVTPFNVQETRVLDLDSESFYETLYTALTEGRRYLKADRTYLDLPAYTGVRAPRPDNWATDDARTLLVLCPFAEEYQTFYDKTLRSIIRAHTRNSMPLRMLDLKSPRLVGQALYEQIRWSTRCLVDLSYWRPNVMFELGVRLACSEHDPLCIIDGDATTTADVDGLEQLVSLTNLLAPTVYSRSVPHQALVPALKAWSSQQETEVKSASLPGGTTYLVATTGFHWVEEQMLERPDRHLKTLAEHVFGKDQERRPERMVLFADNPPFEAALNVAVRQKWIAAWLFMKYLLAEDGADYTREASILAPLVLRALGDSKDRRDLELKREIRTLLRQMRAKPSSSKEAEHGE